MDRTDEGQAVGRRGLIAYLGLRLTCLFLLGVGVAYALGWFEPAH